MAAILGIKKEMVQIYKEDGTVIPSTIVDVSQTKVVGKKTKDKDGYDAVVLGYGKKRKFSKAEQGKYKEVKEVPAFVSEFRFDKVVAEDTYKIGDLVKVDDFKVGDKVNVSGISKGKGFAGVVKRWHFHGGPKTRGQSSKQRSPGAISGGTSPGRIYKGKKMGGHMGSETKTITNLKIVKVDSKNGLLCINGSLPGSKNSIVRIFQRKRKKF